MEELKEYLQNNVNILKSMVQDVSFYNSRLEHLTYFDNDEDFFDTFFTSPIEVARAVCYGKYNYMDEYVHLDVYGNLESCNEFDYEYKLKDNMEEIFTEWYKLPKEYKECDNDELCKLLEDYENEK